MQSIHTSILLIALVILSTGIRLWLASRQIRHVSVNRHLVPARFAERVDLAAHQKAAAYTIARVQLGMIRTVLSVVFVLALTLLGGLQALLVLWTDHPVTASYPPIVQQLGILLSLGLISTLIDLPLDVYRQFVQERRFGFSRTTVQQYVLDILRSTLLGLALGLPMLAAILWLMNHGGTHWWFWAWLVWSGFNLLVMVLYPVWIAPLFNRFTPLEPGPLRERVEQLLARCGFSSDGLFVMDGSRRSAHGNAFFTGFGRNKRIVFFDTLIERLNADEIEAVLAHELGHYHHGHILSRLIQGTLTSLAGLALLAWLMDQPALLQGLGITITPDHPANSVVWLILLMLLLPLAGTFFRPVTSLYSRRHEFEADQFAARHANPAHLISALIKLYADNASTLTPDPLHSAFHDSHPPASIRIAALERGSSLNAGPFHDAGLQGH